MSEPPVPARVLILGGGTAGWMAACLIQRRWGPRGCKVTLVESADIGIIGVGEGSTPQLKHFFDTLGVSEAEWMPRCNATYKNGIAFRGWSARAGHEGYFHPFPTEVDGFTSPKFFYQTRARRAGQGVPAHPDAFYLQSRLAAQRLGPIAPANFPFHVSYGYHFDAYLVGAFLREIATSRGVERIEATIGEVVVGPDGNVEALLAKDGRRFDADLFVDASGFRAAIIEGALGERYIPFANNLFNDSAVVLPTPVSADGPDCATTATALGAGWAWHIPLTNRSGNGYVYSSRFTDAEAAERELRALTGVGDDIEARHLKMRVGRVERSWVGNCLAIGLAQGFVEPLEATALHVVLATVEGFLQTVDRDGTGEAPRAAFNRSIAQRMEGIRDYLVCHYRAAGRADTDYWRAATGHDELSDSLKAIFTCWFTGGDLAAEIDAQGIGDIYPAQSWHCLMAGYGNFPADERLMVPGDDIVRVDMAAVERFIAGCAMNFSPHNQALGALQVAGERVGGAA